MLPGTVIPSCTGRTLSSEWDVVFAGRVAGMVCVIKSLSNSPQWGTSRACAPNKTVLGGKASRLPGRGWTIGRRLAGSRSRVGRGVAVAIGCPALPRGRNELHRSDRSIPHGVAVVAATVGVADHGRAGTAIKHRAEDRLQRRTVAVHPAASRVPGLDLSTAASRASGRWQLGSDPPSTAVARL